MQYQHMQHVHIPVAMTLNTSSWWSPHYKCVDTMCWCSILLCTMLCGVTALLHQSLYRSFYSSDSLPSGAARQPVMCSTSLHLGMTLLLCQWEMYLWKYGYADCHVTVYIMHTVIPKIHVCLHVQTCIYHTVYY